MNERFDKVIEAIDNFNLDDPNKEMFEGQLWGKELLYSRRMTEMLEAFRPESSELLRIAAHAQHIGRWKISRSDYPKNKVGYHNWRNDLKKKHSEWTSEIMSSSGYSAQEVQIVRDLLQKKNLRKNDDMKALEDVICLVFLKYYFKDFSAKHEDEKVIDIIQKTWKKMTPSGHEAALKLPFDESSQSLIQKALQ